MSSPKSPYREVGLCGQGNTVQKPRKHAKGKKIWSDTAEKTKHKFGLSGLSKENGGPRFGGACIKCGQAKFVADGIPCVSR